MAIDPGTQHEFIEALRKSGLVEEAKLTKALDDLANIDSLPFGNSTASLTMLLVGEGLLTNWQVEKLRAGCIRGYWLDHFLLLDRLFSSHDSSTYLARDQKRMSLCKVKVYPPKLAESPHFRYEVEDV